MDRTELEDRGTCCPRPAAAPRPGTERPALDGRTGAVPSLRRQRTAPVGRRATQPAAVLDLAAVDLEMLDLALEDKTPGVSYCFDPAGGTVEPDVDGEM